MENRAPQLAPRAIFPATGLWVTPRGVSTTLPGWEAIHPELAPYQATAIPAVTRGLRLPRRPPWPAISGAPRAPPRPSTMCRGVADGHHSLRTSRTDSGRELKLRIKEARQAQKNSITASRRSIRKIVGEDAMRAHGLAAAGAEAQRIQRKFLHKEPALDKGGPQPPRAGTLLCIQSDAAQIPAEKSPRRARGRPLPIRGGLRGCKRSFPRCTRRVKKAAAPGAGRPPPRTNPSKRSTPTCSKGKRTRRKTAPGPRSARSQRHGNAGEGRGGGETGGRLLPCRDYMAGQMTP
jgi:hypothetical protein